MPARPLSDTTLQLIHALRASLEAALAASAAPARTLDERSMFGCYCFFVDDKLCMGVKGEELLARLPPASHAQLLETEGLRELSPGGGMQGYFWISPVAYARRADWKQWVDDALAYNPQAKATPKKSLTKKQPASASQSAAQPLPSERSKKKSKANTAGTQPPAAPRTHSRQTRSTPSATSAIPRKHSVFDDDDL